jgi:hypothetical protein
MAEVGKATLAVIPDASGFASKLSKDLDGPFAQAGRDGGRSINRGLDNDSSGFAAFGKKAGGLFAAGFAAIGVAQIAGSIKDFIGDAIGSASDLNETTSKVGQIFGNATDQVLRFSKTTASSLGQSQQAALDGAATFGIFGSSAGLAGDDLATFASDMVTLAGDLASFNNTSPEDAINAIGSALRGEAEPIRAYGVLLDDATLKNRALALGLIATTKDALTPQQKVLAAHAEILAQTATQQGDFARTSEGLANQQRILTAEFENAKAAIGTALLPVVTDLFRTFSEVGVPALQDLAKWFTENEDTVRTMAVAFVDGGLLSVQAILGIGEALMNLSFLALGWFRTIIDGFITFARVIVQSAADAFGWIPGLGPKLDEASARLEGMAGAANAAFDEMQDDALATAKAFDQGSTAVQGLRDMVQKLNGMRAVVTLTANGNLTKFADGSYQTASGAEFRASGGPIRPGQPYIVGENGPELIVPDRSGMVYNQSQIAAAGGGGSGMTVNNNVSANAPLAYRYAQDVARQTEQVWRDAAAVNGMG